MGRRRPGREAAGRGRRNKTAAEGGRKEIERTGESPRQHHPALPRWRSPSGRVGAEEWKANKVGVENKEGGEPEWLGLDRHRRQAQHKA